MIVKFKIVTLKPVDITIKIPRGAYRERICSIQFLRLLRNEKDS